MPAFEQITWDQTKPKWRGRLNHFKSGLTFFVSTGRIKDLETWLSTWEISEGDGFRLTLAKNDFPSLMPNRATLSFRKKSHAALFKLSWVPCEAPDMGELGKMLSNLMAQQIISVQPMQNLLGLPSMNTKIGAKLLGLDEDEPEGPAATP